MNSLGRIIVLVLAMSVVGNFLLLFLWWGSTSQAAAARTQAERVKQDSQLAMASSNAWFLGELEKVKNSSSGVGDARVAMQRFKDCQLELESMRVKIEKLKTEYAASQEELARIKGGDLETYKRDVQDAKNRLAQIENNQTSLTVRQVLLNDGIFADLVTSDSRSLTMRLGRLTRGGNNTVSIAALDKVKVTFADMGATNKAPSSPTIVQSTSRSMFTLRIPRNYTGPVTIDVRP